MHSNWYQPGSGNHGGVSYSEHSWSLICGLLVSVLRLITPQAVAHKHVNILDLIENRRISTRVTVFPNVETLSFYTKSSGKYFPRDHEKAGGVLHYLLRQITKPELEYGRDRVTESLSRMKIHNSRRRRH